MGMFDKIFGPPPDDLDDQRWKMHWGLSMMAVGAVLTILALAYWAWTVSVDMTPSSLN